MILCQVRQCGYFVSGYCGSPLLRINANGQCSFVYTNEGLNPEYSVNQQDKVRPIIIDGEYEEYEEE
jgi:hypothetical protein